MVIAGGLAWLASWISAPVMVTKKNTRLLRRIEAQSGVSTVLPFFNVQTSPNGRRSYHLGLTAVLW